MALLEGSAFVTGAASGIGEAISHALLDHGVTKLAVTDVDEPRLTQVRHDLSSKWPNADIQAHRLDVSKPDEVRTVLGSVAARFGRLDIAVNNAGISGPAVKTHEYTDEEWLSVVNVNMNGVFWCQREQLKIMVKQEDLGVKRGRGCIVNVASMYGLLAPHAEIHRTSYATAKHAVMGLTKADAQVYSGTNIRINALCPGYVATPLIGMGQAADIPGDPLHTHKINTPLRRLGTAAEAADGVVFLASHLASFVHGIGLVVDGGYSTA